MTTSITRGVRRAIRRLPAEQGEDIGLATVAKATALPVALPNDCGSPAAAHVRIRLNASASDFEPSLRKPNARFQPQRLMIPVAAVGCKPMLGRPDTTLIDRA
jgi:hypothetical protein